MAPSLSNTPTLRAACATVHSAREHARGPRPTNEPRTLTGAARHAHADASGPALRELFGVSADAIRMVLTHDGSGVGAGLAAVLASAAAV